MKPNEIRAKGPKEMEKALGEKQAELFALGVQRAVGQLAKTAILGNTKRDIARMLTIAREKELNLHTEVKVKVEVETKEKKPKTPKKKKGK